MRMAAWVKHSSSRLIGWPGRLTVRSLESLRKQMWLVSTRVAVRRIRQFGDMLVEAPLCRKKGGNISAPSKEIGFRFACSGRVWFRKSKRDYACRRQKSWQCGRGFNSLRFHPEKMRDSNFEPLIYFSEILKIPNNSNFSPWLFVHQKYYLYFCQK